MSKEIFIKPRNPKPQNGPQVFICHKVVLKEAGFANWSETSIHGVYNSLATARNELNKIQGIKWSDECRAFTDMGYTTFDIKPYQIISGA